MAGELLKTQDRDTIIQWAERRLAHAARVVGVHEAAVGEADADVGEIRLGFPGYASEEALEPMTWDEWFEIFEEEDLTFAYQLTREDGAPSNYYELHR